VEALSRKRALPILKNLITRETVRFNELKNLMPGITSTVLSDTLLELEHEGLISKKVYPEIPPRVEYKLAGRTRELRIILEELDERAQRWKFSRTVSEGARS
jgi:DNA-binding HxlR family transcriptional regulator